MPRPPDPVREVVDTYFGQKVVDRYRWIEDLKSPETIQWMKAQGKPVLLRVDYDACHGSRGATKDQVNQQLADVYTFLSQQIGRK